MESGCQGSAVGPHALHGMRHCTGAVHARPLQALQKTRQRRMLQLLPRACLNASRILLPQHPPEYTVCCWPTGHLFCVVCRYERKVEAIRGVC